MTKTKGKKSMSRRVFLRQASFWGGVLCLTPFLQACQRFGLLEPTSTPSSHPIPTETLPATLATRPSATPTATLKPTSTTIPTASASATSPPTTSPTATMTNTLGPTATPAPGATQVALVKTTDRAEGVMRAIDLLGINPVGGKRVFVKPNFNSNDPPPASTHIDVLRATLLKLKEMNAGPITVGDRGGMGSAMTIMKNKGGLEMADELGFDFVDFNSLETEDWVMVDPPDNHWKIQDSPLGPGFPFARPILESDAVISVCCLKTHVYGGITMSLKNTVGMVADFPGNVFISYMQALHDGNMPAMIAEINLAYEPALIVLDGVDAFISGGPARGDQASPGVVLVGTDRVAIDAIGVAVLKMHKSNLPKISKAYHLRNAIQLGLGADQPEKIHILTDDEASTRFSQKLKKYMAANWS